MKIIKTKIQSREQRDSMVVALANAGYKVWVEVKKDYLSYDCYVLFEVKDEEVTQG